MNLVTHRGAPFEYEDTDTQTQLFSVTQIRKVAHDPYAGIPLVALELARRRGELLHTRFWKLLASRVGIGAHPEPLANLAHHCLQMDEWVVKNKVVPVCVEQRSCNLKLGYAGQIDAQVQYGPKGLLTIVDLKTGAPNVTDPMQLIAYNQMDGLKSERLLDLYLTAEGVKEVWTAPKDKMFHFAWFCNALGVLKGRRSCGL